MDKLWLIIKREYLTRVTKKSFILTTILMPLGIALFTLTAGMIMSYEGNESVKIWVVDESNILNNALKDETNLHFTFSKMSLEQAKKNFNAKQFDGILYLPPLADLTVKDFSIYYYSDNKLSLELMNKIDNKISDSVREYKIAAQQLNKDVLESLKTAIKIDPEPLTGEGEDESVLRTFIAAAIGGFMGMVMYLVVFIYGSMVMRSVMEEKMNRIIEVIISSVKPFQLMLGKILGVGAVGLTQIAVWAVLIPVVLVVTNFVLGTDTSPTVGMNPGDLAAAGIDPEEATSQIKQAISELQMQNWWLIVPCFIFYFICGYILYASLFAAIGSAVGDDLGESQSLTIPITIPVILALYIMFVAVRAPNSSLAIWASIFPLFSPIVMPARLAFNPPVWQLLLSMLTLVATCLAFVWMSGRIYRIGILMYGKKVTFKEISKWMFFKD
ncbi:MAG: ABC transporter permease [Saprospiraceae bacterium]|nr:ABC transporter permease [Saprospiraceae bacterium]